MMTQKMWNRLHSLYNKMVSGVGGMSDHAHEAERGSRRSLEATSVRLKGR